MDIIKFVKERNRMCRFYKENCLNGCPAGTVVCKNLNKIEDDNFEIVNIVEKWSKEHPRRTFLQDFLEKYPKAPLESDKIPKVCPYQCGYTSETRCEKYSFMKYDNCVECWNRPMEE